jgi:2-polyprenyl-3-methyl-5-hydroxy-6-metoxy-1,4-benzoquinol methylase
MDLARYLEQSTFTTPEVAYNRAAGYRFAQRYVEGKPVADICWDEVGYGSRLLAETAESVAGLTNSSEAVDVASETYSASNVTYKKVNLPELPYSEDSFETVVAFGVVENLQDSGTLLREVKRVLKEEGTLVVSASDKQAHPEHREGMYALQFWEALGQYFEHVHMYRQGAVTGSLILPDPEKLTDTLVESAAFPSTSPHFGVEPPPTHHLIAVCRDAEIPKEKQPYLLLDRNRCIIEEYRDRVEDVELLREEIKRMQETEVQAFQDALMVERSKTAQRGETAQGGKTKSEIARLEAAEKDLVLLLRRMGRGPLGQLLRLKEEFRILEQRYL